MTKHAHGDPRRPDGDLVSGVEPFDARSDADPEEFGPKVGWGHDAVFRPPRPERGNGEVMIPDEEPQGTEPA